jgi:osmotically-inducible protein OsmY
MILLATACVVPLAGCGERDERSSVQVDEVSANESARPPRPPASPVPEPHTVEEAARAAQRTHEVTRALMAETTLDATYVDVITHEAGRTVFLRGVVPSTRQRELAERLARGQASDYAIRNELEVGP